MLRQRVVTATFLVAGFLAALFWAPPLLWWLLVVCATALAAREWAGLAGFSLFGGLIFVVSTAFLGGVAGWLAQTLPEHDWICAVYAVSVLFWVFVAPLWLAKRWVLGGPLRAVLTGWVVLVPIALALAHVREVGAVLLLGAMSLVWVADMAAYFSGRAFGRRKLAPSISPGKTREGAYGAILGVIVVGLIYRALGGETGLSAQPWPAWLIALLVLTVLSILGDLFESLLKRQAGVKDSGNLLPGHGGVLDRIDSLAPTLPLIGLIILWAGR